LIEFVRISHFRALQDVHVRLRPLTVLVGPNDSGKTSFLEAVHLHLGHQGFRPEDSWRFERAPAVETLADPHNPWDGSSALFRLPSQGIPMESAGVSDQDQKGAPPLRTDGANVAAFIDYLLRKDRQRFDLLQEALRQRVPGLEEIRIATPAPAQRAISLAIEGGLEVPGEALSTGVRMLLFFVALAHHPNPPDVALIDEPETGVHPKRLGDIVELLRKLTRGEIAGHRVQVILSTHSPYLLDHVHLPEDQILVFAREGDGRRTVQEADASRLRNFLDEFMLGEVWFNQGEEGLVTAPR
jgi:predicted ATPase